MSAVVPYIPPERKLPEITAKAVVLGAVLAVILGAANTYLGLRVGLTVSASIPAAVISMAVLRLFRKHNILENNIVQTAASAGESLAAGVLFTIPALLILGYWSDVGYIETTVVALAGGTLGVLFTVPLRRALIVEAELTFPEGIATSEVLKAGEGGDKAGVVALIIGAIYGLGYKFMQSGMKMWEETALFAKSFGDKGVFAFGSDLSPALLAVGYIVRLQVAVLVFMGGVIGWFIAIPLYSYFSGDSTVLHPTAGELDWMDFATGDAAGLLWSTQIRYMGVGAMLIGGIYSLVKLRKPLASALSQGMKAKGVETVAPKRTEIEFGTRPTMIGVIALVLPIFGLYWYATESLLIAAVLAVIMVITGFFFSAVAGYMAGLVGSSNNPISGVTIITVLFSAFSLKFLGVDSTLGPAATIFVAAVIACAGAIAGDNMQDLKAGYLLGATPRNQQIMQIIGVVAAALAIAPVLNLLHNAYTIGSADLAAPQAGLMAAVGQFVFGGGLPMTMISIGAGIAVALIVLDEVLARAQAPFRTPVMPVAVGIYLPVGLSAPIFLGGLVAYIVDRAGAKGKDQELAQSGYRNGVLLSSGLIAGEALVGIGLAGIIVAGADGAIAVSNGHLVWPGLLMFGFTILLLWYLARRPSIMARGR